MEKEKNEIVERIRKYNHNYKNKYYLTSTNLYREQHYFLKQQQLEVGRIKQFRKLLSIVKYKIQHICTISANFGHISNLQNNLLFHSLKNNRDLDCKIDN